MKKLTPSTQEFQGTDRKSLQKSFINHLLYSLCKDEYSATQRDFYDSLALAVRDRLVEKWIKTQQTYYRKGARRIYYLSMEYLMGRLLGDALINLGLYSKLKKALSELGFQLEELSEMESDAGLGNGGLGRLASCFMDSMATLELPAYGYGIRYDYGIFYQKIIDGYQAEAPDHWLRYGNPWEIERPEYIYPVKFYGKMESQQHQNGDLYFDWIDAEEVIAMAYDTPIPGYGNNTVNNLRLWSAKSTRDFNLEFFNSGNYGKAVEQKIQSEMISKVLYPRDDFLAGRELRLKQEYFLVSASLQDIVRRYKKTHSDGFQLFPKKVAIQLNDTHPVLSIPELMRILLDQEHLTWEESWDITVQTFGYTNHTVLPEALEKWRIKLMENLLPRHMHIIYEINRRWLNEVTSLYPGDLARLEKLSIIEEGKEKRVRMANLAIVGSHSVNGVAALHTDILKSKVFKEFYEIWPEKFNNKTNGITQRRWLKLSNPSLSKLISSHIGDSWITDLNRLTELVDFVEDEEFQNQWMQVKRKNKERLVDCVKMHYDFDIQVDSLFDVQVKRIHEYKRQLLNALHVITLYNRIKEKPKTNFLPRTILFGGKAAPAYTMAKLIIKLINSIADKVNQDPEVKDKLRVLFMANYSVSQAQMIIPAADLSEQISTAGMEASGTGNMKFALNGALTIGTLDGANIEIQDEVGKENIFIFGLTAAEVQELRETGYNPGDFYEKNPELRKAIDMIQSGYFSPSEPTLFQPIIDSLFKGNDYYLVLADYEAYIKCQEKVTKIYKDQRRWTKMSIINVARVGKFSSDRTIMEYAKDIWKVKPMHITMPKSK
ncbi:MAG: glycogen/starch/alpha-glucan phosphorylase [bacterium]|nr:MAG: glycogen/starch/alpha-glucan phosphorylase [bacterium]